MATPWPTNQPTPRDERRYADAVQAPFWLDSLPARIQQPPLEGHSETELCVIGGGFTGLWAAIAAKERSPQRDVVVLEAATVGNGASGRNGGFVSYSLTHGLSNGLSRFPAEMEALERLGMENFAGMRDDIKRYAIDCDWEETGVLATALEPHEERWLADLAELSARYGHHEQLLDRDAVAARVRSPLFRAGLFSREGHALVDPARLATGLLDTALRAGVRVYEHSPVTGVHRRRDARAGLVLTTHAGSLNASKVLLATSAYPPLLGALKRYIAPVYDYVLMTEPLSSDQRAEIGWEGREGIDDCANQFHYYRQTADHRILFGGYDAVYRRGGPVSPIHDAQGGETFAKLSQHFVTLFPQLEDIRFSHRWGGAIDTCSRFSVFFGTALGGDVAYALGYTGLGVCATRFGARVGLDLLDGLSSEAAALKYVRRRPVPFPPEPARSLVIGLTRNRLAAADRNQGRRGLWLRSLDKLGLGFDS